MSIDEAIAHARENAKEQRYYANFEKRGSMVQSCLQCAEEHEQLAEWLEELKAYREIGTVEGYKRAIECYTEEYTIRKSNKQYNKAIDDFVKELCKAFDETTLNDDGYYPNNVVRSIAEQLKAGESCENN